MNHVSQVVEERVSQLTNLALNRLGIEVVRPRVKYDARGTIAGFVNFLKWEMHLNVNFLNHHAEEYIDCTIGHEFAHLTDVSIGGSHDVHGNQWKSVMRAFYLRPEAEHRYDLRCIPSLRRIWVCDCTQHHASKHMHKKLMGGEAYICNDCESSVRLYVPETVALQPA